MSAPDVTVVIPCYNAERWVAAAVESVLAQPDVAVEIVVVDDGSTDGSLKVVEAFGDRIRWESGPNRGACAARNRGLGMATADCVAFLDADDYFEGTFLAAGLAAMRRAGADIAFGPMVVAAPGRRVTPPPPTFDDAYEAARYLLDTYAIGASGAIMRRDFLVDLGGWRESLSCRQDTELWFRALTATRAVTSWREGAAVFRQHDSADRITGNVTARKMCDTATVLFSLRAHLSELGFTADVRDRMLRKRCYYHLRRAARSGDRRAYEEIRAAWRALGGRRHEGGLFHRTLASLVGLRLKEQLRSRLRVRHPVR